MSKCKFFRGVNMVLTLVILLAIQAPILAAGEAVSIVTFDQNACTSDQRAWGSVDLVAGTASIDVRVTLTNETKGTSFSGYFGGVWTRTVVFLYLIPPLTEVGDSISVLIEVVDASYAPLVSTSRQYVCGAGSGPGPDMGAVTSNAVVGRFVANTAIMQTPGVVLQPEVVMEIGKTLWVLGVDETGMYYKVLLSGQPFWVPVSSMGPNYDDVWNGMPLPIVVVG